MTIDQAVAKALGNGPDYMLWNEAIRGLGTELWQKGGESMGSVADRHQWAIERGKEYDANPYQRALLVYIAFRVGPENEGAWPNRDTIKLNTGMHKNTITRALAWWVDRGVLRRTRRQHGSTIYQIQEHPTGAIESKNTPEVLSIEPLECSNSTSEMPLKELKDNMHSRIREHLDKCPDAERSNAIRHALDYWPDWTNRPEEAISYYLGNWDKFKDEVLRRSDTDEVEVDRAGQRRLRWGT